MPRENIFATDLAGVVYKGRTELMDEDKIQFAQDTPHRSLAEVIAGADIFLGLSAGGVLKAEMVKTMARDPLILAMANPDPEITPEEVAEVRDDAIVATGRSDYPNQVNNVLCFPFIFRGALDVGATMIKALVGELVNEIMYDCQQFHGGYGLMQESTIERMFRDARVHSIGGGATEIMLEEVAKRMV
jgi:malic enzyme